MNAPDHREPLCGEASPGATPGDGLDAAMGKTHNNNVTGLAPEKDKQ